MTRPAEAAGARWDEIDLQSNLWVIPSERMKMKRPHKIPLSHHALELLKMIKTLGGGSEFLFPSDRKNRQHRNSQTANTAIKRMGFDKRLVAHGLRSLASTTLNEEGFDYDLIEASLAHSCKDTVRSAYNHAEYLGRRKTIMDWWSDRIIQASSRAGVNFSSKNA
jgi:integrase